MARRVRFGAAVLLAALGMAGSGCAYVTAQPVKPGDKINGIRIYDVKPLLVVTGESVTLQYVPNYNRAYALRFGAFLAKNHFQASMTNGLLTNVNAALDSTEFIKVLTALIEKLPVPGEGFSGSAPAAKGGIQNRFQVYEIVFDDDGNLVGLRPLLVDSQLLKVRTTAPTAAQGFSGGNVIIQQQPQPGQPVVVPQPDATPQPPPATGAG